MRSDVSSKDTLCEVHQTVDGYAIYCPSKDYNGFNDYCWWAGSYDQWYYKAHRKYYPFKWWAVMRAKALEEKLNAERREAERRRNFVEKKVWR